MIHVLAGLAAVLAVLTLATPGWAQPEADAVGTANLTSSETAPGAALLGAGQQTGEIVVAADRRGGRRSVGRSHRGGHGRSYSYYRPYRSYFSLYYTPYWYRPYYHYGYYGYGYNRPYRYEYMADAGAVDLNIKPKKAGVYLDGNYIGTVGNYDGFPRYLWLREGEHQLVIHKEGYETLERNVRIQPGVVIKLQDRLVPGQATDPEEYFAHLPVRDSVSESAPEERAERAPRVRRQPRREGGEEWREARRPRSSSPTDLREEPATLSLKVHPPDAVVYLDGRFLGSGQDLEKLHSDLLVDPGSHKLEITRPGFRSETREFDADAGEAVDLEVELDPDGRTGLNA